MLSFFRDEKLECILTIEELESGDWLKKPGLADNQAAEDEYKRLTKTQTKRWLEKESWERWLGLGG